MDIRELAARQLSDFDRRQPGMAFANCERTLTLEEAYGVQMEVARLRHERGELPAGYKIGCVSAAMQAQLGLDRPVFGHVFATELHPSGAELPPGNYDGLAIEGEFALRLARDIPDAAWLRSHPGEAISSAFAVIELHNYVFRREPRTAQELIANNAIHAGAVLPLRDPAITDPGAPLSHSIAVLKNGEGLGSATGSELPGGPYASVIRLAEHLAQFGRALRRGQLILTGSPLPLYRIAPGDEIEVVCQELGGVIRARVARA